MKANEKSHSSLLVSTLRILLLVLCICGVALNRSAGNLKAVAPGSSLMQCDRGMSRHGLQAIATVQVAEAAVPVEATNSKDAPVGMALIPGGRFWMGTNHMEDAQPVHQVEVKAFWMDRTDVTNEEFAKFVKATGYVTLAERPLDPKEFPNLAPDDRTPGSVVFSPPPGPIALDNPLAWWKFVHGANWRHPQGPNSDIRGKETYPVVHIEIGRAHV